MTSRKLTSQERHKFAAARSVSERMQHPGASVTVDEDTDDNGQPVYRVRYFDPYPVSTKTKLPGGTR